MRQSFVWGTLSYSLTNFYQSIIIVTQAFLETFYANCVGGFRYLSVFSHCEMCRQHRAFDAGAGQGVQMRQ